MTAIWDAAVDRGEWDTDVGRLGHGALAGELDVILSRGINWDSGVRGERGWMELSAFVNTAQASISRGSALKVLHGIEVNAFWMRV